jgi:hypothetical protein
MALKHLKFSAFQRVDLRQRIIWLGSHSKSLPAKSEHMSEMFWRRLLWKIGQMVVDDLEATMAGLPPSGCKPPSPS